MGKRRQGRELVIQYLYWRDTAPETGTTGMEDFWKIAEATQSARTFAEDLMKGLDDHLKDLDGKIDAYAKNWESHRLAAVDRNVLRLALHEMYHREDIPPIVSLNEAVEIAKRFSTEESGKFVNGVLDRAIQDLDRSPREAVRKN